MEPDIPEIDLQIKSHIIGATNDYTPTPDYRMAELLLEGKSCKNCINREECPSGKKVCSKWTNKSGIGTRSMNVSWSKESEVLMQGYSNIDLEEELIKAMNKEMMNGFRFK